MNVRPPSVNTDRPFLRRRCLDEFERIIHHHLRFIVTNVHFCAPFLLVLKHAQKRGALFRTIHPVSNDERFIAHPTVIQV